jgi:hypothetical protein
VVRLAGETKSEKPLVAFKTLGDWSATESYTLIRSISMIYNVFLVLNLMPDFSVSPPAGLPADYDRFLYGRLYRSLRIEIESMISRYNTKPDALELRLSEVLQNLDQYLSQDEQLMVYRIRLGSEGVFSFTGFAEIINQVREFIKDLSFRNKKEKQLKAFEITEKALDTIK